MVLKFTKPSLIEKHIILLPAAKTRNIHKNNTEREEVQKLQTKD